MTLIRNERENGLLHNLKKTCPEKHTCNKSPLLAHENARKNICKVRKTKLRTCVYKVKQEIN